MRALTDIHSDSEDMALLEQELARGGTVVIPTDTVYGIAALASREDAVRSMYLAKGRKAIQPTAIVFSSFAAIDEMFPSMSHRARWACSALLPGPWTLVVHNHDEVTPWLTGGTPGAPIGLRLPSGTLALPPVAATSANLPGEPTITRVDQLPDEVTKHVACAVDVGPIASAGASTVLDLTQWESGDGDVVILRDAAGRAGSAIAALECAPER